MSTPVRHLLAAAALLVAATAFGASADLAVSLEAPGIVDRGVTWNVRATVENLGPDAADETTFSFYLSAPDRPLVPCQSNADLGTLAPGERRQFDCSVLVPASGHQIEALRATAYVQSRSEPQQGPNNSAWTSATIASPSPDVMTFLNTTRWNRLAPALPVPLMLSIRNMARTAATGLRAVVDAPYGFATVPSNCAVKGTRATCMVADVPAIDAADSRRELRFEVMAPDVAGPTKFTVRSEVAFETADATPENNLASIELETIRTVFVTSSSDSGDGSLRSAIETANGLPPEPTLIAFRMGRPDKGWHSIRPVAPLPAVTAPSLTIDGTTQEGYFGNTNPSGPEVEIDGSATAGADGLFLSTPCGTIRGLAINGFQGAAIATGSAGAGCMIDYFTNLIEKNYLGIDPTGTRAIPNGRGMVLTSSYRVTGNVISGNRRAGIFVAGGAPRIDSNIVGLAPRLDRAIPNGASGIYLGPKTSYATIQDNHIGFNGECGVAMAWGATYVDVRSNSFQANGGLAIDYGINGPSPEGPVRVPEITSAKFVDGRTIIEGRTRRSTAYRLTFYATGVADPTGYGEGQFFLGEIEVRSGNAGTFRFVHDGDLRQRFVAATITHLTFDPDHSTSFTSEFSRAVEVK